MAIILLHKMHHVIRTSDDNCDLCRLDVNLNSMRKNELRQAQIKDIQREEEGSDGISSDSGSYLSSSSESSRGSLDSLLSLMLEQDPFNRLFISNSRIEELSDDSDVGSSGDSDSSDGSDGSTSSSEGDSQDDSSSSEAWGEDSDDDDDDDDSD